MLVNRRFTFINVKFIVKHIKLYKHDLGISF